MGSKTSEKQEKLGLPDDFAKWSKMDWHRFQLQGDLEYKQEGLVEKFRDLARHLTQTADRLEATDLNEGTTYAGLNSCGEVQTRGTDLDREVVEFCRDLRNRNDLIKALGLNKEDK